ncbi:MAG: DMT family transporter [Desulfonatronovibrionaceae bacterium]
MNKLKGTLFILGAAVLWGCIGPVARLAFAQGMTPLEVALWRAVFGWFFFVLHAVSIKQAGIRSRDLPLIFIFGLVCVTGFYGSYQLAVNTGGAALASVLLYTAPAWVALLAWFFLKEKITFRIFSGMSVSMAGVALISVSSAAAFGKDLSWTAVLFGLLAGFTYALYYIFGKILFARYQAVTVFSWILITGAAGLLPVTGLEPPPIKSLPALVFLGFMSTYLAYFAYSKGLMLLKASQAAVIATVEPVVATLLAYIFWRENLGLWGYAGALLVISGVIIQSIDRKTPKKPEA